MHPRFRVAALERIADVAQAVWIRRDQARLNQFVNEFCGAVGLPGFQAPHAFGQRLFERAADGHHFAHALHLRAQHGFGAGEFFKLPARNFRDHVIDGGLKTGGRFARNIVLDLVQAITHGQLRGNFRDGETGGLRRQRRAARDARIHLDDHHAAGFGIDGELHVRSAGIDADFAQARERGVAHHLIFAVGQRLRRRDGDRIAGVHAHRVEIFDGADDDGVIGLIAHHLQFEFLPAQNAFFDQCFMHRRQIQAALQNFLAFLAVVGDAAAAASHGEAGPQNHRVADARREFQAFIDGIDELRLRQIEADLLHRVFKQQTVLGAFDGIDFRADQFHSIFIEYAGFGQGDRKIQSGLPAHGREQGVGAFAANHLGGVFHAERLHVGAVRQIRIGHDGGGIRIDQHDFVAVALQGLARLGAGIVEFAGLSDNDGTAAHDHDAMEVVAARH